jgi:hypothetical protein
MLKPIFSDSIDQIPYVAGSIGASAPILGGHPIALTILRQLSQDFTRAISFSGSADSVTKVQTMMITDYWIDHIALAIEAALSTGTSSYLVIDFGDPVENWVDPPSNLSNPKPGRILQSEPTISRYLGESGYPDEDLINGARYLEIENPYPFHLKKVLNDELQTLDKITRAIANSIESSGQVRIGISNLFQLTSKGGRVVSNLMTRLTQLKSATTGQGVLAYDKEQEEVSITPRSYNKEHESIATIQDRITAITGIPSFTIWGTSEGGSQFGIDKSLHLYSQRVGSMAALSIGGPLSYLAQVLSQDPDVVFRVGSVFSEDLGEAVIRIAKKVETLVLLQEVGAITAIEIRDTIAGESGLGLVLNPTPTIVTAQPATAPTP